MGKKRLKRLMRQPYQDIDLICNQQNRIEWALNSPE